MSLDQIWKQQLALVSYGNEYLTGQIAMQQWLQHQIFNLHQFSFRDLNTQHLLAQHFQVWLEALKKQGVQRISLHHSNILRQEQNPNANVELLSFAHFIVSHHDTHMTAWIFGQELAEWYNAEEDFIIPESQCSAVRSMTYWRFELNHKLTKQIKQDLTQPNWDEIQSFTKAELFQHHYAQDFKYDSKDERFYYGYSITEQHSTNTIAPLPLLPSHIPAPYAHAMLYQLEDLSTFIEQKINHPYDEHGVIISPEQQLNLRHFSEKIDDITAKFIVKVANHYPTAKLTFTAVQEPFDETMQIQLPSTQATQHPTEQQSKKMSVFTLIIVTALLCLIAFYYGF